MNNNNGWITDRLPTEDDADYSYTVWTWSELHKRHLQTKVQRVALGQPWHPVVEPPPYEKPRWKPKEGELYWYIYVSGIYFSEICKEWSNGDADMEQWSVFNCFQNRHEAAEMCDKFKQLLKEHHDGK